MNESLFLTAGKRTVTMEQEAIAALEKNINADFAKAGKLILACSGRVVVTGMGKSGHIANKIAATLASTGTPAFFMHPGEASHGDLGMITKHDIVLAISGSGSTQEIITLLPLIKRLGAKLIAMTGNAQSTLSQSADIHLEAGVDIEACPLNLAPTSSTTAALVMGDALAVALLEARGFSAEDFAFSHPGGALGKRLLLKVNDIMHSGNDLPTVKSGTPLGDTLVEITQKKLGMTTVIDSSGLLIGVFTDGDLRRAIEKPDLDLNTTTVDQLMTKNSKTVDANILAAEALKIMEDNTISALVVVDKENKPHGVIHLHALMRAGVA